MKLIKILEIECQNWKGMNFRHTFGENENRVSGRNRSGKTMIMRAWNWLMSGYSDANTPMNSDLFDNRFPVTKDTPAATVIAKVSIDGEVYVLERSAKAKFTRKRGTDIYEKATSDEYSYKIDEIERNATDFREWIAANIGDEDMVKYMLDGSYFINMVFDDKKKARQLIEKTVGTVTREEMKGDYSEIDELLQKYSLDEIEAQSKNMAAGINQRLNEIPTLIANAEREISEIEQNDFTENDRQIAALEKEREQLDHRLLDLTARVKPQMEARYKAETEKRMKQEIYEKAVADFIHANDAEISRLQSEISAINRQNAESQQKYNDEKSRRDRIGIQHDAAIEALKQAELKRERLLKERDDEKKKTIDPSATVCPHCGAQLTGDKLQSVIDNFERIRRENIDRIVSQGRANNAEIERLTAAIENAETEFEKPMPEVIRQPTENLEAKVTALAGHIPTKEDFNNTDHGKALIAEINSVVIPDVVMPDDTEIKNAKTEVNANLVPLYERRGLKSRAESLKKQVMELRTEQVEKGAELAKYERRRQLVKDYKQEQMEILSHKVNGGLKFSRIECWSTQKDGTVVPDLVLKDAHGVSFSTTNNASRIVTTTDIQRFFCEKLGVNMPVFVDESSVLNSENLPRFENTQMFYLFCSDEPLKIETI